MASSSSSSSSKGWLEIPGICRISTAVQGGPVWLKLRESSDFVTASRVAYAADMSRFVTAKQYAYELTTGAKRKFDAEAKSRMALGTQNEDGIRWTYSELFKVEVKQVGLAVSLRDPRLACSPDGLVGDDGLVEFKYTKTLPPKGLSAALMADMDPEWEVPHYKHIYPEYFCQIQQQLFVMGRQWCDFVVYCHVTGEMLLERVPFRPKEWADIAAKLEHFWDVIVPNVKARPNHYRRKYRELYEPVTPPPKEGKRAREHKVQPASSGRGRSRKSRVASEEEVAVELEE